MLSTDHIHIYCVDIELQTATHFLLLGMKLSVRRHNKQMLFMGFVWSVAVLPNIHSIKLKTGSV